MGIAPHLKEVVVIALRSFSGREGRVRRGMHLRVSASRADILIAQGLASRHRDTQAIAPQIETKSIEPQDLKQVQVDSPQVQVESSQENTTPETSAASVEETGDGSTGDANTNAAASTETALTDPTPGNQTPGKTTEAPKPTGTGKRGRK